MAAPPPPRPRAGGVAGAAKTPGLRARRRLAITRPGRRGHPPAIARHALAEEGSSRSPGEHPYAAWIETYADADFDAAVGRVEALTDRLAAESPHTDAMLAAYTVATDAEWRFWDQAWHG